MRDCAKANLKDLLPDLLHDSLPPAVSEELRAHVDACEDCRAELDLLIRVRAMAVPPPVNALRIANRLPPHRARSPWRRSARSPYLRVAAAIVLLVAIGSIGTDAFYPAGSTTDTSGTPSRVVANAPLELPIGDGLADLTDADLRTLLEELGQIEAVTPQETEVIAPSLGRDGA